MPTQPTEPTEPAGSAGTEVLQQQLVESLMAVIGAPDDVHVARAADEVLHTLDARLAARPATASAA